jgi:uncharacterized protein (DUF2164 family)
MTMSLSTAAPSEAKTPAPATKQNAPSEDVSPFLSEEEDAMIGQVAASLGIRFVSPYLGHDYSGDCEATSNSLSKEEARASTHERPNDSIIL